MWNTIQVLAGVWLSIEAASIIQPEWGYYFEQDDQGPGTYSFSYDIEDPGTHNVQFRRERRLPNGTVTGSYGLVEPDGNIRIVHYTADELGYRAVIENSKRPDEAYPAQPALWRRQPTWDLLWDPPQSPALGHALQSLQTLGRPVDEQRTPPVALGDATPTWNLDRSGQEQRSAPSSLRNKIQYWDLDGSEQVQRSSLRDKEQSWNFDRSTQEQRSSPSSMRDKEQWWDLDRSAQEQRSSPAKLTDAAADQSQSYPVYLPSPVA